MDKRVIIGFVSGALASTILAFAPLAHALTHWRRMFASHCVPESTSGATYYPQGVFPSGSDLLFCPFMSGDDFDVGSVTQVQVEVVVNDGTYGAAAELCRASHNSWSASCGTWVSSPTSLGYHNIAITDSTNLGTWSANVANYPYVYVALESDVNLLLGYKVLD